MNTSRAHSASCSYMYGGVLGGKLANGNYLLKPETPPTLPPKQSRRTAEHRVHAHCWLIDSTASLAASAPADYTHTRVS